jgi:hypothetical protein
MFGNQLFEPDARNLGPAAAPRGFAVEHRRRRSSIKAIPRSV